MGKLKIVAPWFKTHTLISLSPHSDISAWDDSVGSGRMRRGWLNWYHSWHQIKLLVLELSVCGAEITRAGSNNSDLATSSAELAITGPRWPVILRGNMFHVGGVYTCYTSNPPTRSTRPISLNMTVYLNCHEFEVFFCIWTLLMAAFCKAFLRAEATLIAILSQQTKQE